MRKGVFILAGLVLVSFVPVTAGAEVAGYNKGFFVQNDEGSFKLTFNGRVQTKFFWERDPRRVNADTKAQYMSFQMRRALLGVRANYHDVVSTGFILMHAVTSAGGGNFQNVQVAGATASVDVIPELSVTAGMVGLPLDMITDTSSAWYITNELPLTATQDEDAVVNLPVRPSFSAPDGLGVNFSGGYWKWFYSASLVNGAESNYRVNPNRWLSLGFRTGFNILDPVPGSMTDFECSETPKLTVSAGTMYQGKRNDANTTANVKYMWTSSLGVGVRWGGFSFTSEGYYRKTRMTTPGNGIYNRPSLTDIGYYTAAGYYVIPKKLEIAGQAGQIVRQGPSNDSWQFGGGLNYYIFDNNLKLQVNYVVTASYNNTDPAQINARQKVHNISAMASAIF